MRRLGGAGIVILGLWATVQAILLLNGPISWFGFGEGQVPWGLLAVSLVPPALLFALGAILIWRRDALASRWFDDDRPDLAIDGPVLLRLGIMLLGLSLVVDAFPSLVESLLTPLVVPVQELAMFGEVTTGAGWISVLPRLIIHGLELLIGIALMGSSSWLSRRLWPGHQMPHSPAVDSRQEAHCASCDTPYDPDDYREGARRRCVNCGAPLDDASA